MSTQSVGLVLIVSLIIICGVNAKNFACNYRNLRAEFVNGSIATCEFNKIRYGNKDIFNIILPSQATVVVNLNETDAEKETRENKTRDAIVKQVKFNDSWMYKIPNSIFATFEHLEIFNGAYMRLKEISTLSFNKANNLKYLFLQGNRLTVIKNHIFVHCKNVKVLDLSNNTIESIPKHAFRSLHNLERLDLSMNKIKSIMDGTFDPLVKIEYIWLKNNQIRELSSNVFGITLKSLSFVNLGGNELSAISPYAFENLLKLRFLILTGNKCVNDDFTNMVIVDNTNVKYKMRECFKAYNALYSEEEEEYSFANRMSKLEVRKKNCMEQKLQYSKAMNDTLDEIKELN